MNFITVVLWRVEFLSIGLYEYQSHKYCIIFQSDHSSLYCTKTAHFATFSPIISIHKLKGFHYLSCSSCTHPCFNCMTYKNFSKYLLIIQFSLSMSLSHITWNIFLMCFLSFSFITVYFINSFIVFSILILRWFDSYKNLL